MRPIHTSLPEPTAGMLLAKRPTGITMAIVVVVVAVVAQSAPGSLTKDLGSWSSVVALLSFGIALLMLWIWLAAKEGRRFATLGFEGATSTNLIRALRGFGLGVAMIALCALVPVLLGQAQLTWASPDAANLMFVFVMLIGFLVQGSTEEILTRGYLTQAVARRWGLIAAVIVQTVFFTVLHGMNDGIGMLPIINLALFALFASIFSLSEGSLWGISAWHAAWNWAQGNLFGVSVSGHEIADSVFSYSAQPGSIDLLTGGNFGLEGSLVTTVAYLIGIVITWRVLQKKRAAGAAAAQPVPATA